MTRISDHNRRQERLERQTGTEAKTTSVRTEKDHETTVMTEIDRTGVMTGTLGAMTGILGAMTGTPGAMTGTPITMTGTPGATTGTIEAATETQEVMKGTLDSTEVMTGTQTTTGMAEILAKTETDLKLDKITKDKEGAGTGMTDRTRTPETGIVRTIQETGDRVKQGQTTAVTTDHKDGITVTPEDKTKGEQGAMTGTEVTAGTTGQTEILQKTG